VTVSLSPFVCPSVRPLVTKEFFSPKELKERCFKVSQGCFSISQGCFKGVSRKFQGCFTEVTRVFQGSFKGVWKFQGCFTEVSRVFHGSFKGVSRKFTVCSKEV